MTRQGSRDQGSEGARGGARSRIRTAFTLIELLVVIAIIGLLITAIFVVGGKVIRAQKVRGTEQIMRTITLAIDQHKEQNPLANLYDIGIADQRTFGPYPPYQVAGVQDGNGIVESVREALDPNVAFQSGGTYTLGERLWRDLGKSRVPITDWVSFTNRDANDDIRALYTYLKTARLLENVPPYAIAALGDPRYVNPAGNGTIPGNDGLIDVLGFVDSWGVPLDYFLYVKLEWTVSNTGVAAWRITDRVPALRSRGVPKDKATVVNDTKDDWIFSSTFPSPAAKGANADFPRNGLLLMSGNDQTKMQQNGWARALGDGDLNASEPDENKLFGYVP